MTDKNPFPARDYIEMPGEFAEQIEKSLENPLFGSVMEAIRGRDPSAWNGPADLISNRLGWLSLPEKMTPELPAIEKFARSLREAGAQNIVLAGMGGSSLMSKVFGNAFSKRSGAGLTVVDTTVPDTISAVINGADFEKTFFIVSSKSGRTVETLSVGNLFFELCAKKLGRREAARRFAVITDPATPLFETARKNGFASIFAGDETVGGRFSPLSFFGLVPAAGVGADAGKILSSAAAMAQRAGTDGTAGENPNTALRLAAAIDLFCKNGNGKFYAQCSEQIAGFDRFVEQIVGESLGKDGVSVLPAAHPVPEWEIRAGGAFFVCLKGDAGIAETARRTAERGIPVVATVVEDRHGLGGEIFRWETAVAVAGALWNVNPFDQPDVESAKQSARRFMNIRRDGGGLALPEPDFTEEEIGFSATERAENTGRLRSYIEQSASERKEKGYFSIQAFLDGSDSGTRHAVEGLRLSLSKTFGITVTADWGPAYLHSSGQIHKGDCGNGFFIQLSQPCRKDVQIPAGAPDCGGASFETLKNAQMLGDRETLERSGRKVVHIRMSRRPDEDIRRICRLLELEPAAD